MSHLANGGDLPEREVLAIFQRPYRRGRLSVRKGEVVHVLKLLDSDDDEWVFVRTENGVDEYVPTSIVDFYEVDEADDSPESTPEDVVEIAPSRPPPPPPARKNRGGSRSRRPQSCRILFNFRSAGGLDVAAGERVWILQQRKEQRRDSSGRSHVLVTNSDGKQGYVPANLVQTQTRLRTGNGGDTIPSSPAPSSAPSSGGPKKWDEVLPSSTTSTTTSHTTPASAASAGSASASGSEMNWRPIGRCVAQEYYTGSKQYGELSLVPGDVVLVFEKSADGWWYGRKTRRGGGSGGEKVQEGYFPANFTDAWKTREQETLDEYRRKQQIRSHEEACEAADASSSSTTTPQQIQQHKQLRQRAATSATGAAGAAGAIVGSGGRKPRGPKPQRPSSKKPSRYIHGWYIHAQRQGSEGVFSRSSGRTGGSTGGSTGGGAGVPPAPPSRAGVAVSPFGSRRMSGGVGVGGGGRGPGRGRAGSGAGSSLSVPAATGGSGGGGSGSRAPVSSATAAARRRSLRQLHRKSGRITADVPLSLTRFEKKKLEQRDFYKTLDIPKECIRRLRNDDGELIVLGEGKYGKVFKCLYFPPDADEPLRRDGMVVAVKVIAVDFSESIVKEVGLVKLLEHPLVVNVFGFSILSSSKLGIVMEFVEGGALFDYIHNTCYTITNFEKWFLIKQMIQAIDFLHRRNVIHRDIKSLNFLCSKDRRFLKIADFGLAKIKPNTATVESAAGLKGTIRYCAPELSSPKPKYGVKSDVFALGMTIFEVVQRKIPFEEQENEIQCLMLVLNGDRPEVSPDHPPELVRLVEWSWQQERDDRPNCGELLAFMNQCEEDFVRRFPCPMETVSAARSKTQSVLNFEELLRDPITGKLMTDPVTLVESNQTYERCVIQEWLRNHDRDPLTDQELITKELIPNHTLRSALRAYHQQRIQEY